MVRASVLPLTIALVVPACVDGALDPLDTQTLEQLARTSGSATGSGYTGTYRVPVPSPSECVCASLSGTLEGTTFVTSCGEVATRLFGKQLRLEVRQRDGDMFIRDTVRGAFTSSYFEVQLDYVGGVDADGTAALGHISVLAPDTLTLHARIDATFLDGGDGTPPTITGSLDARLVSRDLFAQIFDVDCRIRFDFEQDAEIATSAVP